MLALKSEEAVLEDDSCWITVGNMSVYIQKGSLGVTVSLFPLGDEFREPLASTWLSFVDAMREEDNKNAIQ